MIRIFLAALVAAIVMPAASTAARTVHFTTRTLSDVRVGKSKPELVAQIRYSGRVVARLRHSWRVAPRHATCWSHVPWAKTCDSARRRLIIHRWLLAIAEHRLDRMYPSEPQRWQYPSISTFMLSALTCIHGYEGAWNDETGNGFNGGLQMDAKFEVLYGPEFVQAWGPAGNWPAWAQLIAGVRAHDGWPAAPDPRARAPRGFYPWPNTARACGLI